jgi:hypothetical protein
MACGRLFGQVLHRIGKHLLTFGDLSVISRLNCSLRAFPSYADYPHEQMEFACLEGGDTDLEHYTVAAGAPEKPK